MKVRVVGWCDEEDDAVQWDLSDGDELKTLRPFLSACHDLSPRRFEPLKRRC